MARFLWEKSLKFKKDSLFNGKYFVDILVSDEGSILCYIEDDNDEESPEIVHYAIITKDAVITPEDLRDIYADLVSEYVDEYVKLTGKFKVKSDDDEDSKVVLDVYTERSKYVGSIVSLQSPGSVDTTYTAKFSLLNEKRTAYARELPLTGYVLLASKKAIFVHGVGLYKWK